MSKTVNSTHTATGQNFSIAHADGDAIDPTDIEYLGAAVQAQDHTSGYGTAVGRLQTGTAPAAAATGIPNVRVNGDLFQWWASSAAAVYSAVSLVGTQTLTNKTLSLASNTLTGTTAQFNTALSDNDFATLAGAEELTTKTLTAAVAKGTWTASGTWTIPAVTLGGTVSGGGNQINNVIIGSSTPLAGSFTTIAASGLVTLANTAGTARSLSVSAKGNSGGGTAVFGTSADGLNSSHALVEASGTTVTDGSSTVARNAAFYANMVSTYATGHTMTRLAQFWAESVTASNTGGTLTNHNAAYFGTPVNGTTVKTIDTASGGGTPAHLTTSGSWTNASSFAATKDLKGDVPEGHLAEWWDYLQTPESAAKYYRYPTVWGTRTEGVYEERATSKDLPTQDGETAATAAVERVKVGEREVECVVNGGHQEWEHDSLFPLLDTMPDSLRLAITGEAGGAISTKDMDGTLWALLREAARRIAVLEADASR